MEGVMGTRQLARILTTVFAVGLAAACDSKKPAEVEAPEAEMVEGNLMPELTPIFINQSHPWAGEKVEIRDYNGDAYRRCIGPDGPPAANVGLSAQFCISSLRDSTQLFTVVGFSSGLPTSDPSRVALRSVLDSRYCVDVETGTANGGERMQLYPCHYGANQLFHLPMPATANAYSVTGSIRTRNSNYGMAFEAEAPTAHPIGPVRQQTYSSSANYQIWYLSRR
jgi:hypothetical protein